MEGRGGVVGLGEEKKGLKRWVLGTEDEHRGGSWDERQEGSEMDAGEGSLGDLSRVVTCQSRQL